MEGEVNRWVQVGDKAREVYLLGMMSLVGFPFFPGLGSNTQTPLTWNSKSLAAEEENLGTALCGMCLPPDVRAPRQPGWQPGLKAWVFEKVGQRLWQVPLL